MSSKCSVYIVIYVLWVEIWSTECMQYESAENKWANVGEQSVIKIVRLFVKFSELRKIFNSWSTVFFGLLEKFHALGNSFFICWITFHFEEFQSAAIGKKIKIKMEVRSKIYDLFIYRSELFILIKYHESFR